MATPLNHTVIPVYQDSLLPSKHPNSASDERGYQRIRVRQDTRENWLKNDPILASGEFGYVIGYGNSAEMLKIGDGTVRWSNLPWVAGTCDGGSGSPTIVSEDEPAGSYPEGSLWIDPTCDSTVTGTGNFSNLNPPVYADPPVTQQANGLSIGLSPDGLEYHEPPVVGAIPVSVGGKTYLMPLIEAPGDLWAAPLFTFDDPPTTQTLDGDYIGVSPDGQVYFEPMTVGGIPVVVAGKTYLLPLWNR
jgi:hypothetical protein